MGIERDRTVLPLRKAVPGGRIAGAITAALLVAPGSVAAQPGAPVEITILDVGQGDAIVVRASDGTAMMVDAGPEGPLRSLSRLGVDSLDLVVATHPHDDHIGGMDAVLTARPVGTYVDAGAPATSEVHQRLNATLNRLGGVSPMVATDTTLHVGSMTVRILAPMEGEGGSVGVVVRHGAFTALLPGDAGEAQIQAWLARDAIPEVTVLKASDHGGVAGLTIPFVDASSPEVVVISVGADDGGPRPEALTAYGQVAHHILRTDVEGHVTIRGFMDGRYEILTGASLDDPRPWAPSERGTVPTIAAVLDSPGDSTAAPRDSTVAPVAIRVVVNLLGTRAGDLNGDVATIVNRTARTLDLSGWRLCDLSARCFRFPMGTRLPPARQVAVYTGYGMPDGVSFFMNNDRRVWNEDGDEATLYDETGRVVARHVY